MEVAEQEAEKFVEKAEVKEENDTHTEYRHSRHDFVIKLFAFWMMILFFPIYSTLMINYGHFSTEAVLSQCLLAFHLTYFMFFYRSLYYNKLYRIKPRYSPIKGRSELLFLSSIERYPEIACESISEMSNVRGALNNLGLLLVGSVTLFLYMPIFLYRIEIWIKTLNQTLAAIFSIGAGAGLTTLGLFEMNPSDKKSQIMHYIGFIICLGSLVGLGFETSFGIYFCIICGTVIIGSSAWVYFIVTGRKKLPSKDPEFVNKMSKQCIFAESVVLLSGTLAFDLYLYLLAPR
eukprot:453921_1